MGNTLDSGLDMKAAYLFKLTRLTTIATLGLLAGDVSSAQSPSGRSEEHTSELQSQSNLVCRLLLEKKKNSNNTLSISNTLLVTPLARNKCNDTCVLTLLKHQAAICTFSRPARCPGHANMTTIHNR